MRMMARVIVLVMGALVLTVSHAQTTPRPIDEKLDLSAQALEAREDIAEVLRGEAFGHEVTKKSWRFKSAEALADDDEVPDWLIRFVEYWEKYLSDTSEEKTPEPGVGLFVAKALEVLLWGAGFSLLLFLLYHYREYIKAFAMTRKLPEKAVSAPEVLFGLDVRNESVPENVPEQVLSLWHQGAGREALGLLYRATLSRLIHQYHFTFNESATEKECADLVHHRGMNELDAYMQALTQTWQRLAYGHRTPDEREVIGLCENWPVLFSRGSQRER